MNSPFTCVLFDLDGTIVDSAPGITATLAYTFEELGVPVPSPVELLAYVGPPILDSFRDRGGFDAEKSALALEIYRKRYLEHGVSNARMYPGVAHTLRTIHESTLPLSLATSKPEKPATMILDEFDVTEYFDVITGASEDEVRSKKADVVEEALLRLATLGADISKPVMVGDRSFDVIGAAARNVPTIFVEWGYGPKTEARGAIASVATTAELDALLFPASAS